MAKTITKSRLRRRIKRFKVVYISVVVALVAASAVGAVYLKNVLADYEAAQPIHAAQSALDAVFNAHDFGSLYDLGDGAAYAAEGKDAYVSYMQEQYGGASFTLAETPSGDAKSKKYLVYADGARFGEFTLDVGNEKSKHGFETWALASAASRAIEPATYTLRAQDDSRVYADGALLDESYKIETGIKTEPYAHLPSQATKPTECVYQLTRYFSAPVFTVEDAQGRAQTVDLNEDGVPYAQVNYDDDSFTEADIAYVIKAAKCLCLFTSDDTTFAEMNTFLYPDSNAHSTLSRLETGWFATHTGRRFENSRAERFRRYGDDFFSCDVYVDYVISYAKDPDATYEMAYTFYFRQKNGVWLIYDMMTL